MKNINRLLRYDWPLHFILTLTNWFPDNLLLLRLRGFLASPFLKKAGKNIQIGRDVTFYNSSNISIGNDVYIAKGTWLSAGAEIDIGDKVLFGPYVVIVTSNHSIKNGSYYDGPPIDKKKVIIGKGSWIGAHATILAGVEMGQASLLGANSLLSQSTEPYSIYGGIPAKLIKYAKNES